VKPGVNAANTRTLKGFNRRHIASSGVAMIPVLQHPTPGGFKPQEWQRHVSAPHMSRPTDTRQNELKDFIMHKNKAVKKPPFHAK